LEIGQVALGKADFFGVKTGFEKLSVNIGGKDDMVFVFDYAV
jgi:hypothetical protein